MGRYAGLSLVDQGQAWGWGSGHRWRWRQYVNRRGRSALEGFGSFELFNGKLAHANENIIPTATKSLLEAIFKMALLLLGLFLFSNIITTKLSTFMIDQLTSN